MQCDSGRTFFMGTLSHPDIVTKKRK